ncbi:hypothetical protein LguiA_000898 [Lonicera macranthoides]
MLLTRSNRRLLDVQPASPTLEIIDETISADNFSLAKRAKMSTPVVGESSCNWHSYHVFIQFMEEEFDTGRMGMDNTLSAKQVNEISQKLKEHIERYFDAVQIIAKFARMKAKTNAFHKLINTTGFGWCSKTNTITTEENVWETYLKANPTASVFKNKGLHGYEKLFKIFKNTTATGVFGRASNQGPLDFDDDMDVGGGPSMFRMDDAYVHGSEGKSRSSKRTKSSLDALLETMSETSRAKRARYDRQATSVEVHSMIECMSVLKDMPVFGEKYACAADKLISGGKDWRSFFVLLNPDRQLEWVNGL